MTQQANTIITDLGFNDLAAGVKLFKMLQLNSENLIFQSQKLALMNIARFVNDNPGIGLRQLRRVASKKPLTPDELLQRFAEFVELQDERVHIATELEENEELKARDVKNMEQELKTIDSEINLFL